MTSKDVNLRKHASKVIQFIDFTMKTMVNLEKNCSTSLKDVRKKNIYIYMTFILDTGSEFCRKNVCQDGFEGVEVYGWHNSIIHIL